MRIRILGLLGLVTMFAIGVASPSFAQDLHVTADIPFAFHVEGKTLPAGTYDFRTVNDDGVIRIAGKAKGAEVLVPALTRMAAEIHNSQGDSHIVFDDLNGVNTLSEIWAAGDDGYLVHATKPKHKHHVIKAAK